MKIEIEITKLKLFIVIALVVVISGVIFSYAYSNPPNYGNNPAQVGHSVDEIDWSKQIMSNFKQGYPSFNSSIVIAGASRKWIILARNTSNLAGDGITGDNNLYIAPSNNAGTDWDWTNATIIRRGDVCELSTGKCLKNRIRPSGLYGYCYAVTDGYTMTSCTSYGYPTKCDPWYGRGNSCNCSVGYKPSLLGYSAPRHWPVYYYYTCAKT